MAQEHMIGEVKALSMLEDVLNMSLADQTEIVLEVGQQAVTRYANNAISQNVSATNTRIAVRAVVGTACARVFTNRLDLDSLRQTIENATTIARNLPADTSKKPPTTYLAGNRANASARTIPLAPSYTSPITIAAPFFFPETAEAT